MKLKSITKAVLFGLGVSAAAGASAMTITTPDGTYDFGGFDWSSAGSVLVDSYNVLLGSSIGTTDTFTMYYQSSLAQFLDPLGNGFSLPNMYSASNLDGYEFTIYAEINEQVTCLTTNCSVVQIDILSGSWNIMFEADGDSSLSNGTGFLDGTTVLSGTFLAGISDSVVGLQGASNPGNVTLAGTFRGDVMYTNTDFINPELIDTEAVSTLQFGTNTTAWTRPTNFEVAGLYPIGPNTNTRFVGQADANQTFTQAVPEPASLALMGLGLFGIAAMRRRQV